MTQEDTNDERTDRFGQARGRELATGETRRIDESRGAKMRVKMLRGDGVRDEDTIDVTLYAGSLEELQEASDTLFGIVKGAAAEAREFHPVREESDD